MVKYLLDYPLEGLKMKTVNQWLIGIFSLFCCLTAYSKDVVCEAPSVEKRLENYDVIATNVATIPTAFAFRGDHLTYAVSAHPKSKSNKVIIDAKTGVILIKAEKKDLFDVIVKVKNSCGLTSAKFNVQIDEEE